MDPLFTPLVHTVVSGIPRGKVATYGQVAALAGRPNASRAVGMIMSRNTDTTAVPCHRVVGSTGALTGYAYGKGLATKRVLLQKEGVAFRGERVHLAVSQWKPRGI